MYSFAEMKVKAICGSRWGCSHPLLFLLYMYLDSSYLMMMSLLLNQQHSELPFWLFSDAVGCYQRCPEAYKWSEESQEAWQKCESVELAVLYRNQGNYWKLRCLFGVHFFCFLTWSCPWFQLKVEPLGNCAPRLLRYSLSESCAVCSRELSSSKHKQHCRCCGKVRAHQTHIA